MAWKGETEEDEKYGQRCCGEPCFGQNGAETGKRVYQSYNLVGYIMAQLVGVQVMVDAIGQCCIGCWTTECMHGNCQAAQCAEYVYERHAF